MVISSVTWFGIVASMLVVFALSWTVGGSSASAAQATKTGTAMAPPSFSHVFIVLDENHSYRQVAGATDMPYLNKLISTYGIATQFYANAHPSIGNYLMLTTGALITTDDASTG